MTETPALKQFGPFYPKLGERVEKFRRLARMRELSYEEKCEYGDEVGRAIRALQRTELFRYLQPAPPATRPPIPPPPSVARLTKYTVPNPFPMHGDPVDRCEESLYRHAMKNKNRHAMKNKSLP